MIFSYTPVPCFRPLLSTLLFLCYPKKVWRSWTRSAAIIPNIMLYKPYCGNPVPDVCHDNPYVSAVLNPGPDHWAEAPVKDR